MKRLGTDVLYFEIGKDNRPTLFVEPGEVFEVQTEMNPGPWLEGRPDAEEFRKRVPYGNPTGCIYVNGVKPGDMVTIEILDMQLGEIGFTSLGPRGTVFYSWLDTPGLGAHSKVVQIRDGKIFWDENLILPARPMIGFIGVAPARERYTHAWNGPWGGNFDLQEVTTGVKVHLKAECEGALIHVGDVHAIQGDGEICGAGGIESSALIKMRVTVRSPAPEEMHWPRLENDEYIMTCGFARPAEDAFRIALEALIKWMVADYGFTAPEAYLLLGQVLEARCSQFVTPRYTYVCKIRREYLRAAR